MTTFDTEYSKLSDIDKSKVFNYKEMVIKWVDGMKSGETMRYDAHDERKLIYFAVVDVESLHIFGKCMTYKGYSITFKGITPNEMGIEARRYYDRN